MTIDSVLIDVGWLMLGNLGTWLLRLRAKVANRLVCRLVVLVGNSLTVIGCLGLILGLSDLIPTEFFAIGISSGIRVIGSVAIAGCLMSALGYGVADYFEK